MVTADEIRARVEAADRARIHARADAAAQIAADVERRTTVAAELAEIDASLTAQIDAAAAVMTLAELAEFTGIPETELRAAGRRAPGAGAHDDALAVAGQHRHLAGVARSLPVTGAEGVEVTGRPRGEVLDL